MIEYEVEITSRPLGVRFAHADHGEAVVVHLVLENKLGHKLGLLPGDILIGIEGKSVLDTSSAEALAKFRNKSVPFKASFRRFDDDDEFYSDEEESDLNSHYMAEDSVAMLANLKDNLLPHDDQKEGLKEWLANYGESLGDKTKFEKCAEVFLKANIDLAKLKTLDKEALLKLGLSQQDAQDLSRGIQLSNGIIVNADKQVEKVSDPESKGQENWEPPFLPYMYDAPKIKLSQDTKVSVYASRVVAPYKKKPFALYEIEVVEGQEEWLLSKRYSEFYRLYNSMKKLGVHTKIKFPQKGVFNKSTDKQVMEERKKKLTDYLSELLKQHSVARESKELNDFLSPSRTFVVDE